MLLGFSPASTMLLSLSAAFGTATMLLSLSAAFGSATMLLSLSPASTMSSTTAVFAHLT